MRQIKYRNIYVINSATFVVVLLIVYTLLAALVAGILPPSFYTFSSENQEGLTLVWISFPFLLISFFIFIVFNKWMGRQDVPSRLLYQVSKICCVLAVLHWMMLIGFGILARFVLNMSRGELLTFQHSFLISGTSFVYILAFIHICRFSSGRLFWTICFCFLLIDFLYMGKKFVFYLIALFLFRFDCCAYKKTLKPVFFALTGGLAFAVAIYFVRATVSGGVTVLDLYALFAEFVGVVSTVGFAIQYGPNIDGVWSIVSKLQPYYLNQVGHGLALHPIAYFVVVGGEYWLLALVFYLLTLGALTWIISMLIGDLALLLVLVNIIHFFRHGPDIFIFQLLTQSIVVILVCYIGLLKKRSFKIASQ